MIRYSIPSGIDIKTGQLRHVPTICIPTSIGPELCWLYSYTILCRRICIISRKLHRRHLLRHLGWRARSLKSCSQLHHPLPIRIVYGTSHGRRRPHQASLEMDHLDPAHLLLGSTPPFLLHPPRDPRFQHPPPTRPTHPQNHQPQSLLRRRARPAQPPRHAGYLSEATLLPLLHRMGRLLLHSLVLLRRRPSLPLHSIH